MRSRRPPLGTVPKVNLLDLLLLAAVVVAVVGGWRVGLVARLATWAGLAAGFLASSWTVPTVLDLVPVEGALVRLFTGLLVVAFTVSVVTSLFQLVGSRVGQLVSRTPLRGLDRAAGAAAGTAAVLAVVWFLVPAAAEVPGAVARQVRSSAAVGVMRELTPAPPDAARTVRALIDSTRFPEVFEELAPAPETGPPPESLPVPVEVVERVTASTVNVEATGCGRRYEGSGFALAPDLVVTNAHVVAGAETVTARRPDGARLTAVVTVFDPDRDLALLRVPGLGQQPLRLAEIEPGSDAVTIGYPGGQDRPRVAPARVEERRTALGRDIYGEERTRREVLFLAAALEQGDSGSPVVDTEGNVGGLVFAISPDQPTTAYALDLSELRDVLSTPTDPGATGACI